MFHYLCAEKLSTPAAANSNKNNPQIFTNSNINQRLIKSEPETLHNRTGWLIWELK